MPALLVAAALAAVVHLVAAPAQSTTADASRPEPMDVWIVRIRGPLENARLADDVHAQLRAAEAANAGLVVLELDANAWRPDVVWSIGESIRAAGPRVIAFLNDPSDRRVGLGAATLAASASACYLSPRTMIASGPGDDARLLAPDDTDWERVERELQGSLWAALRDRGADTQLVETLLTPTGSLWAVPDPATGDLVLSTQAPAQPGRTAVRILEPMPGAPVARSLDEDAPPPPAPSRVRIPAQIASDLRIATGMAHGLGEILADQNLTARKRTTVYVESGFEAARRQVEERLAQIDAALARIDVSLDFRDPGGSTEMRYQRRRAAARSALPLLRDAAEALERAEELFASYPELLRTPVPGRTAVGNEDTRRLVWAWRDALQDRRDTIARLAERAREYGGDEP